jgi:hypothetical protein
VFLSLTHRVKYCDIAIQSTVTHFNAKNIVQKYVYQASEYIIFFTVVCRNTYRVLLRQPEGKRPIETSQEGLGSMESVRIAPGL